MTNLEDGYLIVLPRDEAKAFFGHREDQARLDFIHELLANADVKRLSCEGKWNVLQAAFEQVDLDDSLLGQCLMGGRPLHGGDDYVVCLVRPDIVGFITRQSEQLQASYLEQIFKDDVGLAQAVLGIYKSATEAAGAVVFVAQK